MWSLLIMFVGLCVVAWGAWSVRGYVDFSKGFTDAMVYYLVGGAVILVGVAVDYWAHERRERK